MSPPNRQCTQEYQQSCRKMSKSRYWNGHRKLPWNWKKKKILKKFVGVTESGCKQGGPHTWHSYASSVWRYKPKFQQLLVRSLWKATQNDWPSQVKQFKDWNNSKMEVNAWPTGNVMKELKTEIHNSLYYYSDISDSYSFHTFSRIKMSGIVKNKF